MWQFFGRDLPEGSLIGGDFPGGSFPESYKNILIILQS